MVGVGILSALSGVQWKWVIYATLGMFLIVILYYFIAVRPSKKVSDKIGGRKVRGLVIDDVTHSIRELWFKELGNNVYGSTGTNKPMFLVVPPGTKAYQYKGDVTFMAYGNDVVLVPIDPNLISKVSTLLNTDDLASIRTEDLQKILKKLFELEESKTKTITISPDMKIGIAFDIKRVIRELLDKTLGGAGLVIQHFFRTTGNIEKYENYLRAMTEYESKRYSWVWIIGISIFLILIGVGVVLMAKGGGIHPHG